MMRKEKIVDESWKESATKEKEQLKDPGQEQAAPESFPHEQDQSQQISEELEQTAQTAQQTTLPEDDSPMEVSFLNYITSLAFQAMVFLGEVPNPFSNKEERNLQQAKLLIDTFLMLKEKTKGNLTRQEENMLNASVYELQMKYVEMVRKEQKGNTNP